MQRGFKTNESEEAFFSDPLESFQSGEFYLILGQAFIVVDEFQINQSSH